VDTGDALIEHGRVLQIEAHAAGISGDEHLNRIVLAKPVDQFAAPGAGHASMQSDAADSRRRR
jgi:hypothetical protein